MMVRCRRQFLGGPHPSPRSTSIDVTKYCSALGHHVRKTRSLLSDWNSNSATYKYQTCGLFSVSSRLLFACPHMMQIKPKNAAQLTNITLCSPEHSCHSKPHLRGTYSRRGMAYENAVMHKHIEDIITVSDSKSRNSAQQWAGNQHNMCCI